MQAASAHAGRSYLTRLVQMAPPGRFMFVNIRMIDAYFSWLILVPRTR